LLNLRRGLTTDGFRSGGADADVPGFEVFLDAFGAAFAAEAGVFDAAEGCGRVRHDSLVDAVAKTATIRVYWDHWKKTDAGWRKTTRTWYGLD